MKEIYRLIEEREKIRKKEKELTAAIIEERRRAAEKKPIKTKGVSYDDYDRLRKENADIRGLIAFLKKADRDTYEGVAKMLGVSPSRAKDIVERGKRFLRWVDRQEDS